MLLGPATLLAFVSGFVALGYEVLWARRLADVIGATALASSLVVGAFFVMLSAGAVRLGPLAARQRSPWRLYALLEGGILLAILPAFAGDELAGVAARALGDALVQPGTSLVAKTALALLFVGPAAFLMGGTLPAMGQAVVRAGRLGNEGNILYGVNTLGGALGSLVATFDLVPALGMRRSFLVLMLGSATLAVAALRLAAVAARAEPGGRNGASGDLVVPDGSVVDDGPEAASRPGGGSARPGRDRLWYVLAFVSGFNVLGLEVLALHLFSQVLHNSTYTFATVLVVVIAALALGALVTQRWRLDEGRVLHRLALVLCATALATAIAPRLFFAATGGMQPLGGGAATLLGYVLRIVGAGVLVLSPPFALAGWVFPLVLAGGGRGGGPAAGRPASSAVGVRWGRLLGANAAGALLGLVLANFAAMRFLGLWMSIAVWSLVPLVTGLLVAAQSPAAGRGLRMGLATAAAVGLVAAFPDRLPVAALAPGDALLDWNAGADGVACVVANAGLERDRRIKWNNTYTLGGAANAAQQARMGQLALLLHPRPERVGFIGVATGLTASSARRDPAVRSVTAVELSGQVVHLACRDFADVNGDLCAAPSVRIVVEDGRMFFRTTRQRYDVIVGDLFVPWQAGTATLYTREHFQAVRDHLEPGGLFAQWLPLFQLDAVGFWGIATTFAAVFPNAWLAISDFQPYHAAVALIGWRDGDAGPSPEVLAARCREVEARARFREPLLDDAAGVASFLVGPVAGVLPQGVPPLTLDRCWLADHAPRVQRARPEAWFLGPVLTAYLQRVVAAAAGHPLYADVMRGQMLYQFVEVLHREGQERAAAWFDANVRAPLPPAHFAIDAPGRFNWPFPRDAGLFLVGRARQQAAGARQQAAGVQPPPDAPGELP
jgi:spermidine synthase